MIVVGVTGGIACYKAVELVRLLVKAEFNVRVIMTRGAMEFVTPLTFQTLSGHPVATETFDLTQESEIGHINLADSADLFVIAPATANVIGKIARRHRGRFVDDGFDGDPGAGFDCAGDEYPHVREPNPARKPAQT